MKLTEDQERYANMIVAEAQRQGLNPQFVLSVAFAESNFNPKAVSPKGAIGLMQLMPATAKELGVDPNDPIQNIRGGVQYLKQLSQQFENDPVKVLSAYNAGPNARFFETGDVNDIPTETLRYVTRIADIHGGSIPGIQLQSESSSEPLETQEQPIQSNISQENIDKAVSDIQRRYGQIAGAGAGGVLGATMQTASAIGNRLRGSPPAAPTAAPPATPTAPPGAPTAPLGGPASVVRTQPPLGGSAVQNYAKAFGLSDIEAGRATDMTKQPGGVHDLTTQRRIGLQRVQDLFPNQFREDPRFGGLMTPEERPGLGPRGPTGQIGAGKPPPIVNPPGPLSRITNMFQSMAEAYPRGAKGISAIASRVPIVSYPLAGANIGGESMTAFQELSKEDPDYYKAALSGIGALGTGLSLFPPTAPIGIPLATIPPLIQYFRDRPPDDQRTMNIGAP